MKHTIEPQTSIMDPSNKNLVRLQSENEGSYIRDFTVVRKVSSTKLVLFASLINGKFAIIIQCLVALL